MTFSTRVLAALVVAVGLTAASGCGYALAGRGSFLPAYIRTVGIPQLENRTTFFRVEEVLTEKIRTEFIGRGKYAVRPEAAGADAVLSGEILGVTIQPIALNEQQVATRHLFVISMKVQFTDVRTSEVLWANEALTFREEYDLSARGPNAVDGASFLDQESSTFDRVANDLARTVVTAIVEAF